MKKFFTVLAVAVALTACGGGSESTDTPDTTTSVTNEQVTNEHVDSTSVNNMVQDTNTTVTEAPNH